MFPTADLLSDVLGRFDWLLQAAVRRGPALPVAAVVVVALVEAIVLPRRHWVRGVAVAVVVLCALGAAALLRVDENATNGRANDERAAANATTAAEMSALRGLWAQWDELSKTLPPPVDESAGKFDTVADALASLSTKVAGIGGQIDALKARSAGGSAGRAIDGDTAGRLADELRRHGSFRVVVTCAPSDVEAFSYAAQLVGILRAAGWDAGGPEATANVADQPKMGIVVMMRDPTAPEAAKVLLDAFDQLSIPHQPGIAADLAVPDTATVELYVPKKP